MGKLSKETQNSAHNSCQFLAFGFQVLYQLTGHASIFPSDFYNFGQHKNQQKFW